MTLSKRLSFKAIPKLTNVKLPMFLCVSLYILRFSNRAHPSVPLLDNKDQIGGRIRQEKTRKHEDKPDTGAHGVREGHFHPFCL